MTTICHIDEIPEQSCKGFTLDADSYFVIKKNHQIYAYRNRCPHLGIELNWEEDKFLDFDGMLIQCSTHGALFLIESGECVSGPCLGQQLEPITVQIIDQHIII
ncbi:MAG: Rieske (2Fe-2S) protein [Spongiibacteraceae bacterium]